MDRQNRLLAPEIILSREGETLNSVTEATTPLRRQLSGFDIQTAQEMGWGRVKNGETLKRAEEVSDAFLTADQQLKYQQNLQGRKLAILVLSTNRWAQIKEKTAEIFAAIQALRSGDYVELAL